MIRVRDVVVAASISGAVVASLVVSAVNKPEAKECVIPACDISESPVDCRKWVTGPGPNPGRFEWVGCNVFLKKDSTGAQCLPAPCVVEASRKIPKATK